MDTSDYICRVVADSINTNGVRLTTLHLRYPRIVHAEFMTHRVFSRNARSSRAVPTTRLLQEEPFMPNFAANQAGMQPGEGLPPDALEKARSIWMDMADACRQGVHRLHQLGVHKQWANRPLEWFGWIDVLVTSTDWANFLYLRQDRHAQEEIRHIANLVCEAMMVNQPVLRGRAYVNPWADVYGWHLPYITDEEREKFAVLVLVQASVARSARISYKPFDISVASATDEELISRDVQLYSKLVQSLPMHASPVEHQAIPYLNESEWVTSNFYDWWQFRKMLDGEHLSGGKSSESFPR